MSRKPKSDAFFNPSEGKTPILPLMEIPKILMFSLLLVELLLAKPELSFATPGSPLHTLNEAIKRLILEDSMLVKTCQVILHRRVNGLKTPPEKEILDDLRRYTHEESASSKIFLKVYFGAEPAERTPEQVVDEIVKHHYQDKGVSQKNVLPFIEYIIGVVFRHALRNFQKEIDGNGELKNLFDMLTSMLAAITITRENSQLLSEVSSENAKKIGNLNAYEDPIEMFTRVFSTLKSTSPRFILTNGGGLPDPVGARESVMGCLIQLVQSYAKQEPEFEVRKVKHELKESTGAGSGGGGGKDKEEEVAAATASRFSAFGRLAGAAVSGWSSLFAKEPEADVELVSIGGGGGGGSSSSSSAAATIISVYGSEPATVAEPPLQVMFQEIEGEPPPSIREVPAIETYIKIRKIEAGWDRLNNHFDRSHKKGSFGVFNAGQKIDAAEAFRTYLLGESAEAFGMMIGHMAALKEGSLARHVALALEAHFELNGLELVVGRESNQVIIDTWVEQQRARWVEAEAAPVQLLQPIVNPNW